MAREIGMRAGSLAWLSAAAIGPRVVFAPEGGAGAGDGSPGAAGDGQASGGGDPNNPPATYRPDGLPDHFYGANDRETIDKLYGAVRGYRDADATRGTVPETPDKYTFTASDELKPFVPGIEGDPLWKGIREDAHKLGLTDKVFDGFMGSVLNRMVSEGLVEKPVDYEAELASLVPEAAKALAPDQQKQEVSRRIGDAIGFAKGLANQGLPQRAVDALLTLGDTAGGIELMEFLKKGNRDPNPALPGGNNGGGHGDTPESLAALQRDPRADSRSPKYDPAFARDVHERYKKLYS